MKNQRPSLLQTCVVAGLALLTGLPSFAVHAQSPSTWPDKPIRIVLPFPPGGPTDLVIRTAAERMQTQLKQPLVIENKPGAGGNLGSAEVARAVPDGHTWLWATDSVATVNPHVYKSMGFKLDDLTPVTMAVRFSQVLVCNPNVGVKTLDELVRKAKSDKLAYASGGAGVPGHLTMELLQHTVGFSMQHIPYKGPAPAMQDVLGGQVACGFLAGPTVLPQVRAGKLVALAVSGSERSPQFPDVPSLPQLGHAAAVADFALVMWAPKATPAPIVARMREVFLEALKASDVSERIKAIDMTVVGATQADTAAQLTAGSRKWGDVAKRIQLGLD
jgi:tripartite-type tricarboxylate transporter receptor subunit TctC